MVAQHRVMVVVVTVLVVVMVVVVQELHRWGDGREQGLIAQQSGSGGHVADVHHRVLPHTDRLLLLPHEHVVHDRCATEHDAQSNEHTCDDRRCRLELREGVQDDACRRRDILWSASSQEMFNSTHSYSPVKNIGMEMKNPPTAHARLTLDFWRYLLALQEDIALLAS